MLGIGIDIGATNTKLAILDENGRVFREERFHTDQEAGPAGLLGRLCGALKAFKDSYGARLASVGVGIAGDVDAENGLLRFSPNLRWRRVAVAAPIREMTGLSCFVENDANMAAWGAYALELARGPRDVLALTLGTGIGAGLILDGRLYHGATGSAGEAGHIKIVPGGRACNCGGRGCLEAYCGSYAIVREARRRIPGIEAFIERYAAPGRERLNTICLTRAAAAGHRTAAAIWAEMGGALGRGLSGMLLLLNPGCVVLTGGVSKAARYFMPALKQALSEQQITTPFKTVKIKVAKNADLGVYGSALFGLEKAKNGRG